MFSTLSNKWNLVLIYLFYCVASALGAAPDVNETTITIPLNKTYTYENREIYGQFVYLDNTSIIKVNFTNLELNTTLKFIIFQVHSHVHNITLHQIKKSINGVINTTQVTGTNVGLLSHIRTESSNASITDEYLIDLINETKTIRVYISLHAYDEEDMYPGGCNIIEQGDQIPYLKVNTRESYITIDGQLGSPDPFCTAIYDNITNFYLMYLSEMSFDEDEYFMGIRKMVTLEGIIKNGVKMSEGKLEMRRMVSSYAGTGVIVVAVVYNNSDDGFYKGYGVYVPTHSYGCPHINEYGCQFSHNVFAAILCMLLLFVGIFITFFGHQFFKTEMFAVGFSSGFIITYILISIIENTDMDTPLLLAGSGLSGIFFGAIWLLFWWLYGIPVVAVLLPSLNLGFIIAAIFYYRLPVDMVYVKEDINFWTLFNLIMILTALALISVTYAANITSCSVLGAFATVYALDFYVGSTLKYLIINVVRRAVVPGFGFVEIAAPLQQRDVMMAILWTLLACLGFAFQHYYNRGRAPFPPPPRITRPAVPDETATTYGSLSTPATRQERRSVLDVINRSSAAFRNYWYPNNERTPMLA